MGAYSEALQEYGVAKDRELAKDPSLPSHAQARLANAHAELAKTYQELSLYPQSVQEYEKAIEFYHRILGMKPEKSTDSETLFTMKGMNFYIENHNKGHDDSVFFEFAVEDIEDAKEVLIANNCMITKEFSEKSLMVRDPYGLKFHLFQV